MAHQQPEHTCVVGETVGIDVELSNPLQVELSLTHLRLACTFEPAASLAQPSDMLSRESRAQRGAAALLEQMCRACCTRLGRRGQLSLPLCPVPRRLAPP